MALVHTSDASSLPCPAQLREQKYTVCNCNIQNKKQPDTKKMTYNAKDIVVAKQPKGWMDSKLFNACVDTEITCQVHQRTPCTFIY